MPNGDPAVIFDRALTLLLTQLVDERGRIVVAIVFAAAFMARGAWLF